MNAGPAVAAMRRGLRAASASLVLVLAACASAPPAVPARDPALVHADIVRRLPDTLADRQGWAGDIQAALAAQRIEANTENICAVLAVTAQESGFVANPVVPDLARLSRAEIDRRAAAAHVPGLLVDAALRLPSSDGRSYGQRLGQARTERDLSVLYEDMIQRVPLGGRLFAGHNPVQTGGPMQVSIAFAEQRADGYPWPRPGSIRD